jgi:hypothetical protein
MRITAGTRRASLTYCTNLHTADDLASLEDALARTTATVARAVAPGAEFGLGLRLGEEQAHELTTNAESRARFDDVLARHRLRPFTINGFAQGRFHERRVKEAVYRPDWTDPARTRYTVALARLLASWLPADDRFGTISTLPLWWRDDANAGPAAAAVQLWTLVGELAAIEQDGGARIMACLEPEPGCAIETIPELVAFYEGSLLRAPPPGLEGGRGEALLRRHLGVCYDACHQAVLFADPVADLVDLRAAGIEVGKVQVSSALKLRFSGAGSLEPLLACDEDRFLHQVAVRTPGRPDLRFRDLPELRSALGAGGFGGGEARCHFHVPIYAESFPPLETTRAELLRTLDAARRLSGAVHFEVETYTFHVLPEALRGAPVEDHLVREIEFARTALGSC